VVDYVFIAYYPLNQMYSDFVVPVVLKNTAAPLSSTGGVSPTILPNTSYFLNITNGTLVQDSNTSDESGNGLDRILSPVSSYYEKLLDTGLYGEQVIYEKRFPGENRDSMVTQIISYINLDYILDSMDFETFVKVQGYYCHAFIAVYVLTIIMIVTRRPDTITLSG
jgi:hypothetical protein